MRALGKGLAPRLGESLDVGRREVGLDVGGRRLRGRIVVVEPLEDSGTRPEEEEMRCMAESGGSSGIMTVRRGGSTSAQQSDGDGWLLIGEASGRAYRHWKNDIVD